MTPLRLRLTTFPPTWPHEHITDHCPGTARSSQARKTRPDTFAITLLPLRHRGGWTWERGAVLVSCALWILDGQWRVQVVCTGTEDRLLDCDFPEDFETDYSYRGPPPDYGAPASQAAPPPPTPDAGIRRASCSRNDNNRFSVICRQFEISGAPTSLLCVPGTVPFCSRCEAASCPCHSACRS